MSKSEYRITAKVSASEMPALYRYLENLNLRTIHGRAMLCIIIDRAVALTPTDKARYGSALFGALRSSEPGTGRRRLALSITRDEHPSTMDNLEQLRVDPVKNSGFLHLMEVAAGLLYLDSLGMPAAAPLSAPPAAPVPPVAAPAVAVPPKTAPAIPPERPEIHDAHDIISSSDRGGGNQPLQTADVAELMGA
ncbi:MAG: hypothetical protein M0Z99_19200 [Betaproteobacteria bacterium]|jgi:hypothetical protein|nr:hypothetical protein [Betaproteobacteria bacterium]